MNKTHNTLILLVFILLLSVLLSSCSSTKQTLHNEGVPILTQDELVRPYTKIGRIQVTRETFLSDYLMTSDVKAWGLAAVRREAEKMGADAVMFPEITVRSTTNGIIPSTEYCATGFAIKFK